MAEPGIPYATKSVTDMSVTLFLFFFCGLQKTAHKNTKKPGNREWLPEASVVMWFCITRALFSRYVGRGPFEHIFAVFFKVLLKMISRFSTKCKKLKEGCVFRTITFQKSVSQTSDVFLLSFCCRVLFF